MRIIEIKPLPNGAHRNQTGNFPAGFNVYEFGRRTSVTDSTRINID